MKKVRVKKHRIKKYLIPHEENDFMPKLLRPKFVAFVCMIMIAGEIAFLLGATYVAPRSKLFGIILTNALVDQTNESRTANGVPALHENATLDAAAQLKANDMVKNNYFAHTSPAGLTPWYWFDQVGYNFNYAGENLAVNFSDSEDVTSAWMNSPEHRENILNANYSDIGMATAQGMFQGHPATYVVELFGTQAPVAVANGIPGISSAQAATQLAPTSTATTTAVKPKPKPITKPIATATTSTVAVTTTSVASSGASSIVLPNIASETESTTEHATSVTLGFVSSDNNAPTVRQSNIFQEALADPRKLANDVYLVLMGIFFVALMLNIFIKIRIQYPKLIIGGILVIVVAGLAVMLNQSMAAHIAIL
ncbi:MAG TPA: CAP domain-containing protein [Candidatus Paceibacterota bacterium]|nr:CAP domain-containing protein [Candidatus Paceibacterota bacterium]